MLTMAPPAHRAKVIKALEKAGARIIPFEISPRGLRVSKKS
jgi:hypothetical protein